MRIILSGLLLQYFFKKILSYRQWNALILLLIACIIEQSGSFQISGGLFAIFLVFAQGLCSSLGGVYFQWLLQRQESGCMGIWMKNIYLYFWSIVVEIFVICAFRPDLLSPSVYLDNFDKQSLAIVVVAGLGGVFTSLLLRHLDILVKEYANFAELVVVAIAQNIMFGTPIRATLMAAIALASYSLYMYNTPNKVAPPIQLHCIELSK